MDYFDHEKLHVYQAAKEFLVITETIIKQFRPSNIFSVISVLLQILLINFKTKIDCLLIFLFLTNMQHNINLTLK